MLEKRTGFPKDSKRFEKERKFHQERWSKKEGEQGLFSRKSKEDFMHEEARRDDADFEKRKHIEFQEWEKSLKEVKKNFKKRAENPEAKDAQGRRIRTLIIIMGGGMKSARGAGQVIGLNLSGITADKVDMVGGASGGAVVATEYVAGPEETLKGAGMLTGPMATKKFINKLRLGKVVNLPMAKKLMLEGEYKIDTNAVMRSSTELRYVVTLPVTGNKDPEVRILDAKKIKPNMIEGIVSTMSIPYATGPIPEIDGVKYYDGGFAPLPIGEYIEEFVRTFGDSPTDVLILPNAPFDAMENIKPTRVEYNLASLARTASLNQIEKGLILKEQLRESLEHIKKERGVNIGIMWPPDDALESLSIDTDDMEAAKIASARDAIRQFGGEQPDEIPAYVSQKEKLVRAIKEYKKNV